jgi:hypothetical protein
MNGRDGMMMLHGEQQTGQVCLLCWLVVVLKTYLPSIYGVFLVGSSALKGERASCLCGYNKHIGLVLLLLSGMKKEEEEEE